MHKEIVKFFEGTSHLAPGNIAYIEDLYDLYLKNPDFVTLEWREYFDSFFKQQSHKNSEAVLSDVREYFLELAKHPRAALIASTGISGDASVIAKHYKVENLIQCYRQFGHLNAKLDPLDLTSRPEHPSLNLAFHDLSEADLEHEFENTSFVPSKKIKLKTILSGLKQTYSNKIGVEYTHIADLEQQNWLKERLESTQAKANFSSEKKQHILKMLIWAEEFERYLGAKFVGQTRFSLEGGCSLIPMLDELVQRSGEHQVKEFISGMGHRGRLSVLVNVLGMPLQKLFSEFAKKPQNEERSGDVKYHAGFSSNIQTEGGIIHTALAFNPSHLEIINPVVEGAVRARQDRRCDVARNEVIPILIHGDSAFTGQGVVMETFNFSETRGFTTGGTIHIIVNNQIGFTTNNPHDTRSGSYCTDIAKMIEIPIFHVNGDDPEAVILVTQMALDFRMKFNRDVVIDLVCYRRLGHNEADEPSATQPLMYQKIKQYPRTWEIYAKQLQTEKVLTEDYATSEIKNYRDILDQSGTLIETLPNNKSGQIFADWRKYKDTEWNNSAKTAIEEKQLLHLGEKLVKLPETLTLQVQVQKEYDNRAEMLTGKQTCNWGFAEALAFASLLEEGYTVRLIGQDCGRGTFAHRHAVLHDQKDDSIYIPLNHLSKQKAFLNIYDSTLSEEGVLGFEYGFATTDPETLVIWEAQYGDFVNGAQVVIDQFITSGEQKWARLCGLVMFLPHSYEGAGPEHSSARLERFLQACAQKNIQVCIPSTPAQVFHMLRRQMIRPYRKPLIVLTPKSLLRNKLATSELSQFTSGQFQLLIPEVDSLDPKKCQKVVLCSGKVYYDLLKQRRENNQTDVALIRLEQLYPFPREELQRELQKYSHVKTIQWCQEEPKNQGAWYSIYHRFVECLAEGQSISYVGRPASASPATGYSGVHQEEQAKLVAEALSV